MTFFMQMRPALYVALIAAVARRSFSSTGFFRQNASRGPSRPPRECPNDQTLAARLKSTVAAIAVLAAIGGPAAAFCGFYVAKADSKLFNKSSKVVLARDGNTTAITMASDYEGEPKEFAVVIPVPTFIERKQIGVVETKTIDQLDAYTAPRLVEYHDADPCAPIVMYRAMPSPMPDRRGSMSFSDSTNYRGVTIEATYDVGEYDVSILSAQESDGLINFLNDNGYKIPAGAEAVLGSYIKQKMRFFIAKVNIDRMDKIGNGFLRPLQVRYEYAEIHAADAARHRECQRAAGPDHLRTDQEWPRRDRELPHRQAAVGPRRAAVREEGLRQRSTRRCSIAPSSARTCARCSSNMPGTWPGVIPARPIL